MTSSFTGRNFIGVNDLFQALLFFRGKLDVVLDRYNADKKSVSCLKIGTTAL
ncbi:hypothetical protein [Endozoicomonas sp.]|uniref:hypothetical protein n=1 Tax=Endozoicomonas sp. TaxID=1892382 RepID=UPI002887EACB|nr:hypothetical protein [Endozoicomonas sp.]